MNNTAIKAENISKYYRIGLKDELHDTFAKSLFSFIKSPLKNYRKYRSLYKFDDMDINSESNSPDIICALKDISMEIKQGEIVGIIGRNGAGKSTLLKILSRITTPTRGYAEIHGRISSLLEVGTGFHPELTGRENIYLNGTILGMRKSELDDKFEEIVEFSGVRKFIDTPVKRYSSGMKVRLAFSVAAHLEPEILIVDEVLAVGDVEFQTKCLNKMEDVGQGGRTVLFVSHNMSAISRLCERVILLDEGRIIKEGATNKVISEYVSKGIHISAERIWPDESKAPGGDIARLRAVRVMTEDGKVEHRVDIRNPLRIEMEFDVLKPDCLLLPSFQFFNETGLEVFVTDDLDPEWRNKPRQIGRYLSYVTIPGNFMAEGIHFIRASVITRNPFGHQFAEPNVVAFNVVDHFEGDTARGDWPFNFGGVVRPFLKWKTKFNPL